VDTGVRVERLLLERMFDTVRVVIAADLPSSPAGPRLAQLLDGLDISILDADQALAYVAAVRRQQAWADARLIEAIARFAEQRGEVDAPEGERLVRFGGEGCPACGPRVPAELATELRVSGEAAARLLADSLDLMHRLPRVWLALRLGLIDTWRARLVAEATRDLSAEAAATVQVEILGRIGRLTRHQLRATVDRLAARVDPEPAARAVETASDRRRIDVDPTIDDHAEIDGLLGIGDGQRLDARLDEIADLLDTVYPDRAESHDQRRTRALGLLADPIALEDLRRRAAGAEGDPRALPHTTLYVHLRPDQTFDLEGYSVVSLPTVAELLADSFVTVTPVIGPHGRQRGSDALAA
jgi:Domain of unknown function (DUF222)